MTRLEMRRYASAESQLKGRRSNRGRRWRYYAAPIASDASDANNAGHPWHAAFPGLLGLLGVAKTVRTGLGQGKHQGWAWCGFLVFFYLLYMANID